MVALPADTPVTEPPVGCTVAILLLLLLHVPPNTPFVKPELVPTQAVNVPDIVPADGAELTLNVMVAEEEPQLLVTV